MAWNQRSRIVAIGITIQTGQGLFNAPGQADLVGVSTPSNDVSAIVAQDPTATGAIFDAPDILLGTTGTAGGTIPLRGFGSGGLPSASAFVPGRILQAAGWTETVLATQTGTAQTNALNGAIVLAAGSSSIDNIFVGGVISHPSIGTGLRSYAGITSYSGSSKLAGLAQRQTAAIASGTYTIPPQLIYQLGTLTVAPPLLSISVWRDQERYDYVDCVPTSVVFDIPVANEASQSFPSLQFACKGNYLGKTDDVTPVLSQTYLATPVPPARAGAFYLDRVMLGHADLKFTQGATVGAASNQNADAGQDGYDLLSGTRAIDLDLNQMAETDFDIDTRVTNQTVLPCFSLWGNGAGNRFAFTVPHMVLRPLSPGDRNGYVSVTGAAQTTDLNRSIGFSIF
jgi:hypothetical protein